MAGADHDTPDIPGLPEIQDEAAETPNWVPLTGIATLLAIVLYIVMHAAGAGAPEAEGAAAEEAPAADAQAAVGQPPIN